MMGVCMIAGWARSFTGRLYVLLTGLCLISLGGAFVAGGQARKGLLAASGLLFAGAVAFAVTETVRNVRRIQDERRALEMQMMAYADNIMKEHAAKTARAEEADKQADRGEKSA